MADKKDSLLVLFGREWLSSFLGRVVGKIYLGINARNRTAVCLETRERRVGMTMVMQADGREGLSNMREFVKSERVKGWVNERPSICKSLFKADGKKQSRGSVSGSELAWQGATWGATVSSLEHGGALPVAGQQKKGLAFLKTQSGTRYRLFGGLSETLLGLDTKSGKTF